MKVYLKYRGIGRYSEPAFVLPTMRWNLILRALRACLGSLS